MQITGVIPQLRTTDLAASVDFYTTKLGFTLEFEYEGFYAGVRSGNHLVHLKRIDAPDPSIEFVDHGDHLHLYLETPDVRAVASGLERRGVPLVEPVHETAWGTRECVVKDNVGHTLYFGERI